MGTAVEHVHSFKFLRVHISEDLTRTTGCSKLVKKAHLRLFFLRTLRKNHLSSDILANFYHCTITSILTNCITVWYGSCSASDRKAMQRLVKGAQRIAREPLPAIEYIYRKLCPKRAGKINIDWTITNYRDLISVKPVNTSNNALPRILYIDNHTLYNNYSCIV